MGLQDGQAGMAGAGETEKGQRSEVWDQRSEVGGRRAGRTERRRDEETRGKGRDRETG